MARLWALVVALCALAPAAHAGDTVVDIIKAKKTNEATVLATALQALVKDYKYDNELMAKAYERCEKKENAELVPCLINALHLEKLLSDHKLDVCVYKYIFSTAIQCAMTCFSNYNVNCLEVGFSEHFVTTAQCVGEAVPTFVGCMKSGPYTYRHVK
ncbi:arginine deiminase [Babesia caballi]|uniref:Arginine deiminase n=1 Tax=Babesia caballi TaxID=5871 RepID=A0AAV4LTI1_BABCB|nr:arginine deiminase [Babesia caballi]